MSRVPFTPKQRFEVLQRDGFACQYCGARAPNVQLVVDHIVPVSRGGTNHPTNLAAACFSCNAGKAASATEGLRLFRRVWFVVSELPSRIKEAELRAKWTAQLTVALDDTDYQYELLRQLSSREWRTWDEWHGYASTIVAACFADQARSCCPELTDKRLDLPLFQEDVTGGENILGLEVY